MREGFSLGAIEEIIRSENKREEEREASTLNPCRNPNARAFVDEIVLGE